MQTSWTYSGSDWFIDGRVVSWPAGQNAVWRVTRQTAYTLHTMLQITKTSVYIMWPIGPNPNIRWNSLSKSWRICAPFPSCAWCYSEWSGTTSPCWLQKTAFWRKVFALLCLNVCTAKFIYFFICWRCFREYHGWRAEFHYVVSHNGLVFFNLWFIVQKICLVTGDSLVSTGQNTATKTLQLNASSQMGINQFTRVSGERWLLFYATSTRKHGKISISY